MITAEQLCVGAVYLRLHPQPSLVRYVGPGDGAHWFCDLSDGGMHADLHVGPGWLELAGEVSLEEILLLRRANRMSGEKRMRPITRLDGEPLKPSHLLALLGYEAAELTESQAARLCGFEADVVGFRLLREWALANVRHVLAGGLPNIKKEYLRCEHPICD